MVCLWSVADRHLPRWSWQAKDGTGRKVGMTASQHGYSGRFMGSDVQGVLSWLDAMQKLGCIRQCLELAYQSRSLVASVCKAEATVDLKYKVGHNLKHHAADEVYKHPIVRFLLQARSEPVVVQESGQSG